MKLAMILASITMGAAPSCSHTSTASSPMMYSQVLVLIFPLPLQDHCLPEIEESLQNWSLYLPFCEFIYCCLH